MLPTLLLNASYEPLRVISWQRAVVLLFQGKVDLVEAYDSVIRAVSHTMEAPAVVRLRKYAAQDRRTRFSRAGVYRRDAHTCQYCGAQPGASELTLDHVNPRCRGGRTEWANIVTACKPCNSRKGGRLPVEARMVLARAPSVPAAGPDLDPTVEEHPIWSGYL